MTGLPARALALVVAVVVTGALAMPPPQQQAAAAVADRMVANAQEVVEVIVRAVVGSDEAERSVARLGGTVVQRLGIVDGFVVRIPAGNVDELTRSPGVLSVTENAPVRLMSRAGTGAAVLGSNQLGHVRTVVDANVSDILGIDGSGVSVALVDTGVAEVAGLPKVDRGPNVGGGTASDGYGHGTHLAGIISGNDGASQPSSGFKGVANDSRTVSVKAAADDGSTSLVAVLAALDFVLYQKEARDIRVLALSLGVAPLDDYRRDILAFAVERLWKAGIVVVVAAGNDGELPGSPITSPAYDPYVIAVGSVDTNQTNGIGDDTVHAFSPTGTADRRVDVVAPGQSLVSLLSPGSIAATSYPDALVGDRFIKGTGTSQAAAVVAGVAASLLEARPNLTPDEVKAVLKASAKGLVGEPVNAGRGMVSLARAVKSAVPANATQTHDEATGPVPAQAPPYPPAPGTPDCAWDLTQGPPPPPSDPASPTCGWSGGEWSEDGTFTGASWTGGTWNGASWTGASWTGASWTGASWTGGTWMVGTWTGASWTGASWTGGSWTGASWTGGEWNGASWTGASWTGASWTAGTWNGASWTGASWTGASWTGASWTGASWTGGEWNGASWTGGSWTGASWTGASWTGASWTGASWTGASWTGASWTGASWTGASWTGASWTGASWTGASWTGASWTGASWTSDAWTGTSWS